MKKRLRKLLVVSSLFALIGCAQESTEKDYIARVEDEYLLKSDLVGLDSNFVKGYVTEWVNNNLLYIEATKRGFKANDRIERIVHEFRKSLIVEDFIQNEILPKAMEVSNEDIKKFYERHQDEFILDRPFIKIGYVKVSSRTDAVNVRNKILKAKDFKTAIKTLVGEPSIVETVSERYYDQFSIPSMEIWRIAWNLNKGEVSFPIKSGDSYFLIYLYEKKEAGSKADFELVAEEVKERVIIEKQNHLLDSLITTLKRKYEYEVKW